MCEHSTNTPRTKRVLKKRPMAERFWSKVERSDGCWLWKAGKYPNGYGMFGAHAGDTRQAHRVSYELTFGPIPDGRLVLHTCDVKACVRPDHLYLGDYRDNARDAMERGRLAYGDRNSSRMRPERLPRGDAHHFRAHPETIPRGEACGSAKLTEAQVKEIRAAVGGTHAAIALRYGVTRMTISKILHRKTWIHLL